MKQLKMIWDKYIAIFYFVYSIIIHLILFFAFIFCFIASFMFLSENNVDFEWANVGVAPCYQDVYATITIKDGKDGVVAVLVDNNLNLGKLPVAPKGQEKIVKSQKTFHIGFLK